MDYLIPATPPVTPRDLQCPGAPKKPGVQCEGCNLLYQSLGGENQQAHMGINGCFGDELNDKLDEYAEAVQWAHSANERLKIAEDADDADLQDFTILIESSDELEQHAADIKREIVELVRGKIKY